MEALIEKAAQVVPALTSMVNAARTYRQQLEEVKNENV